MFSASIGSILSRQSLSTLSSRPVLWIFTIGFYGIGDILTTLVGMSRPPLKEGGPVAAPLLAGGSPLVFIGFKMCLLAALFVLVRFVSDRTAIVLLAAFATAGVGVTAWNGWLLLTTSV